MCCSHAELPKMKHVIIQRSNVSMYYGKTDVRSYNNSPTPLKRMSVRCLVNGKTVFDHTIRLLISTYYIYKGMS